MQDGKRWKNGRKGKERRVRSRKCRILCYIDGSLTNEDRNGTGERYVYDLCGNRYDLLNRQIYVKTLDGKEQENSYDGEGLRAGVTENGKRTTFLYYNREILAECDRDSAPIKRYLSGKKYHGKGPKSRMNQSAKYRAQKHNDKVKSKDWTPTDNDIDAFIDEYFRMERDGGYRSDNNYNERQGPEKNITKKRRN